METLTTFEDFKKAITEASNLKRLVEILAELNSLDDELTRPEDSYLREGISIRAAVIQRGMYSNGNAN